MKLYSRVSIGNIPFWAAFPRFLGDYWSSGGVWSQPLYCVVRVLIVTKFLVRDVENCKEGRDCNKALRGEISPIKLLLGLPLVRDDNIGDWKRWPAQHCCLLTLKLSPNTNIEC